MLQLARNLAAEWGVHGIRVNTISPGYIVTPMVESLFEQYPERRDEWPNQNMLGRLSVPEDYSGAAVFLLSDASSFMTAGEHFFFFFFSFSLLPLVARCFYSRKRETEIKQLI